MPARYASCTTTRRWGALKKARPPGLDRKQIDVRQLARVHKWQHSEWCRRQRDIEPGEIETPCRLQTGWVACTLLTVMQRRASCAEAEQRGKTCASHLPGTWPRRG